MDGGFPALCLFIAAEILMGLGVVHGMGTSWNHDATIFPRPRGRAFVVAMGLASGYSGSIP